MLLLLLAASLAGCGGGDSRVATVTGIVKYEGKPIADAAISFTPQGGGRPGYAITEADGTFQMTTFEQNDGALIGMHNVAITAIDETVDEKAKQMAEEMGSLVELVGGPRPQKSKWIIPQSYSDARTSGLTFEVKRGVENMAEFSLGE